MNNNNNNNLFLVVMVTAIPILFLLLLAPTTTFALSNQNQNQTSQQTNETNNFLKAILEQQKLQTQLQQDNTQLLAIKLDTIKAELERILVQLQSPPPIPLTLPPNPPSPFNATSCKPQNENGVLIYPPCPTSTFPSGILPPSLSLPIPPNPPSPLAPDRDCIDTAYGVFCPTN